MYDKKEEELDDFLTFDAAAKECYARTGSVVPADYPRRPLPESSIEKLKLKHDLVNRMDSDSEEFEAQLEACTWSYDKRDQYVALACYQAFLKKYPSREDRRAILPKPPTGILSLARILLVHDFDNITKPETLFKSIFLDVDWEEYCEKYR